MVAGMRAGLLLRRGQREEDVLDDELLLYAAETGCVER
jgi:hypothetical protein